MNLDHETLENLKKNHPAWRLMQADHAPLVIAFLNRVFILANERSIAAPRLASLLEDELYHLRQSKGAETWPRPAADYLDDWADEGRGWLRKFYPVGTDEAAYDLSPAVEKVVTWIQGLGTRRFVGTESRLRLVFDLLKEIVGGSQEDPQVRIAALQKQKAELDRQISRIKAGGVELMDDTATRERFQHMVGTARELLADFREVEQNFRQLDRSTRERIARWDGARGTLLGEILGQRDQIDESDQGRSFRAFWDFLMSQDRQEELDGLLETALALPAVASLAPDRRIRRVHHDWLEAGEHTQRTVALLSRQLRRFLDDQAWLENRRIMEIIGSIEQRALALREASLTGPGQELDLPEALINLPLERPLFSPPIQNLIRSLAETATDADIDTSVLYGQHMVDKDLLRRRIRQCLQGRGQISLAEILERHPLEQGLAELVTYLQMAADDRLALIADTERDALHWTDQAGVPRRALTPRVIFTAEHHHVLS